MRHTKLNTAKIPKYDGYQRSLVSMVDKFFDKKSFLLTDKSVSSGAVKTENTTNQELAKEWHKPIIQKFEKWKVHSCFIDNIWGANLADTQLLSKLNKGFRFLLCTIDIYSKYAWVITLKDKKTLQVLMIFKKFLNESNHKLNKIWVDKGSEFYNKSMKSWLGRNYIEMC